MIQWISKPKEPPKDEKELLNVFLDFWWVGEILKPMTKV